MHCAKDGLTGNQHTNRKPKKNQTAQRSESRARSGFFGFRFFCSMGIRSPWKNPPGLNRGVDNTYLGGDIVNDIQTKKELKNCIIIDWLTFSCYMSFDDLKKVLGLEDRSWTLAKGSRLFYKERWICGSISIHTTPAGNTEEKYNPGSCVEMSGQGCREYESFGRGDWTFLLSFIYKSICDPYCKFSISRLDLAYDDFVGLLDIEKIAMQAWNCEFTSIPKRVSVISDMAMKSDSSIRGITVTHGSKSSNTFFRIYDKRVERNRLDLEHWVRWEIQLRSESAFGALRVAFEESENMPLGSFFAGLILHYVQYRTPSADINKGRWDLSSWYVDFIGAADSISIWSKKDVEYNRARMERYAYKQNHNHTLTLIQGSGIVEYLRKLHTAALDQKKETPQKYRDVLARFFGFRGRFALDNPIPENFYEWLALIKQEIDSSPDAEEVEKLRAIFADAAAAAEEKKSPAL